MPSEPDHDASLEPPEDLTTIHARRAVDGDHDSIAWLVERFAPALLAQARYRLAGLPRSLFDAEDLVQDAWLAALPRLPEVLPWQGRFTPVLLKFLSTAVLNRSNTLYKKHLAGKPRAEADRGALSSLTADATGIVTQAVRSEKCASLLAAIDQLSPNDQEIIVLRGIEQNRNETVAQLLGLKPNTVAVRYRRALERLRKHLPGTVFDELEE